MLDARPAFAIHSVLDLLHESAPHFQGRSTGEVERLRAFLTAKIAAAGLARDLTAFALEDLETSQSAYSLAAAARALRLSGQISDDGLALLERAAGRLILRNEFVDLDHFPPHWQPETTALAEVVHALVSAGRRADRSIEKLRRMAEEHGEMASALERLHSLQTASCCRHSTDCSPRQLPDHLPTSLGPVFDLEIEDQNGTRSNLGELVLGRPSIIAFFYTRCMNPLKCSRTISRLTKLRARLDAEISQPVLVAGMTYDPAFDLPDRLFNYGRSRAMHFSEACLLLRTTGSFQPFVEHLGLGVGYGDSTVNAHQIEWFLTDVDGSVAVSGARRHWDEDELVVLLKNLVG